MKLWRLRRCAFLPWLYYYEKQVGRRIWGVKTLWDCNLMETARSELGVEDLGSFPIENMTEMSLQT